MLISTCAQRQLVRTDASMNSLKNPSRNTTPIKTPTVATDAVVNLSTTNEMSSHAMPVSRNIHQGPASRQSAACLLDRVPAPVLDWKKALMSAFPSRNLPRRAGERRGEAHTSGSGAVRLAGGREAPVW